jgi:hypothetical protein
MLRVPISILVQLLLNFYDILSHVLIGEWVVEGVSLIK